MRYDKSQSPSYCLSFGVVHLKIALMISNNRLISTMLLSLIASSSLRRRCGSVLAFQLSRPSTHHQTATLSRGFFRSTIITRYAQAEDFSGMKVSELRDLLRERGLAVSGIKAELIGRLTSNEEKDDTAGLVDELGSKSSNLPGNLIFAKSDDEDDDPWDDDGDDDDGDVDPNQTTSVDIPYEQKAKKKKTTTKRQDKLHSTSVKSEDFLSTRVFVQNIPKDVYDWKDLKDHFKVAGEVAYASISVDKKTGESKQCGIVQFETPEEAKNAIRIMRDHPMKGEKLYVREDVQETRQPREQRANKNTYGDEERFKTRVPSEWKRANDPDVDGSGNEWYNLKDEELKEIETIIQKRDKQRRLKNYKMSDQLRDELKEEFGVHLDDRLKLWWTDTKHGGVPGVVSDLKGEGRWGKRQPWRQIPTTPESDALVDSELVMSLLDKRDKARRMKEFDAADALLEKAYSAPQGGLGLRIHDESRTWRIWTPERPPSKKHGSELSPAELCLQIVEDNEPEKIGEMKALLSKFPGREWNILRKVRSRYGESYDGNSK
jgi:RNA recognition motif-containing protein